MIRWKSRKKYNELVRDHRRHQRNLRDATRYDIRIKYQTWSDGNQERNTTSLYEIIEDIKGTLEMQQGMTYALNIKPDQMEIKKEIQRACTRSSKTSKGP